MRLQSTIRFDGNSKQIQKLFQMTRHTQQKWARLLCNALLFQLKIDQIALSLAFDCVVSMCHHRIAKGNFTARLFSFRWNAKNWFLTRQWNLFHLQLPVNGQTEIKATSNNNTKREDKITWTQNWKTNRFNAKFVHDRQRQLWTEKKNTFPFRPLFMTIIIHKFQSFFFSFWSRLLRYLSKW